MGLKEKLKKLWETRKSEIITFVVGVLTALGFGLLFKRRRTNISHNRNTDATASDALDKLRDSNSELGDIGRREDEITATEGRIAEREREIIREEKDRIGSAKDSIDAIRDILDGLPKTDKDHEDNSGY